MAEEAGGKPDWLAKKGGSGDKGEGGGDLVWGWQFSGEGSGLVGSSWWNQYVCASSREEVDCLVYRV